MSTPTATYTIAASVTASTNLGPLTTAWQLPSSCSSALMLSCPGPEGGYSAASLNAEGLLTGCPVAVPDWPMTVQSALRCTKESTTTTSTISASSCAPSSEGQVQSCARAVESETVVYKYYSSIIDMGCYPPAASATLDDIYPSGVFYSPGISCPSGYATACSATAGGFSDWDPPGGVAAAETAIGCCPR